MLCKSSKISEQKGQEWRHVSQGRLAQRFSPGEDLCFTGAESPELTSQSSFSIKNLCMGGEGLLLSIHSPSSFTPKSCTFHLPYHGAHHQPITPRCSGKKEGKNQGKGQLFFLWCPF